MATSARATREKISTTISSNTLLFLEEMINNGGARNLAEAIDLAVERLRLYENREKLARDTAAYFDGMSDQVAEEENRLATALSGSAKEIDFDREP